MLVSPLPSKRSIVCSRCFAASSNRGFLKMGSSLSSRIVSHFVLRGFSRARASVAAEEDDVRTPIGKNLRGVAENPVGGRDGLAGSEWEELDAAAAAAIWEKNGGSVK